METLLRIGRKIIPQKLFTAGQPVYHYLLALLGAIIYRFPSRRMHIVAITGTKGKTSTAELVNAMLEAAGHTTALLGTLRFKIADQSRPNKYKMSVPGRFFVQKFLREAVTACCSHVVLEMTSEAAKQYRHKFIDFDALIFLNISPEHIESHGGFENYLKAKLSLAVALHHSRKPRRIMIANVDDRESPKFLQYGSEQRGFSIHELEPYTLRDNGADFTYKNLPMKTHLKGEFNLKNIAGALKYAETQDIPPTVCREALEKLTMIRGRVEHVREGQSFDVVVDYAHTADSLKNLYEAFPNRRKICVLGNTGGGRDKWKRPEMAKVADTYGDYIILTNEDPYDEDPMQILKDMEPGIAKTPHVIILDRRAAIRAALAKAMKEMPDCVVLITGKGTDPYIMGADGAREAWDDATVVREELQTLSR
jgi:UDP-N-acetylmuramoyl-L-alanyl-D-glutamate--2,6-diaminopimelate ligase